MLEGRGEQWVRAGADVVVLHFIDGPVDKAPQRGCCVGGVEQNGVAGPAVGELETIHLQDRRASCGAIKVGPRQGGVR